MQKLIKFAINSLFSLFAAFSPHKHCSRLFIGCSPMIKLLNIERIYTCVQTRPNLFPHNEASTMILTKRFETISTDLISQTRYFVRKYNHVQVKIINLECNYTLSTYYASRKNNYIYTSIVYRRIITILSSIKIFFRQFHGKFNLFHCKHIRMCNCENLKFINNK